MAKGLLLLLESKFFTGKMGFGSSDWKSKKKIEMYTLLKLIKKTELKLSPNVSGRTHFLVVFTILKWFETNYDSYNNTELIN